MSKYVDEFLEDLETNPESYRCIGYGVEKGNFQALQYGNTVPLSCITVQIAGRPRPTTYRDRWRMEVAIKKWYKTISLAVLQG